MNVKLVGKQNVDYVSKKTNNPVQGITLHVLAKSDRVEGESCENFFISNKSPMYSQCLGFPLGSELVVQYNRWGSVESAVLVDNKKG